LKLCTVFLYADEYKAERTLQHYRTIQALSKILGPEKSDDVVYLDTCRSKRNTAEHNSVGVATDRDSDELIKFDEDLRDEVKEYLKKNYPDFLGLK